MAPRTKLAAERCAKDGRFSYPPDLQEKVDAYRRARKLSALIQDAIRRAPGAEEFDMLVSKVEGMREFRSRIARILKLSEENRDDILILGLRSRIILTQKQAARIKELEALNEMNHKNMRSWLDTRNDKEFFDMIETEASNLLTLCKRLEAAFLWAYMGADYGHTEEEAREALERIRAG